MSYDCTLSVTHVRRAKLWHSCHWCAERIEEGQPYVRMTGIWDSAFQSNPMHPECLKALQESEEEYYTPFINERGTP
jgi:hypothetical protein